MKRFLSVFLVLVLFACAASADPLPLLEDYAEDISEPYDPEDPSYGVFTFSCRYPHADENAPGGVGINSFYEYLLSDTVSNYVPMLQEAFEGYDSSMNITYTVTCNNDECFSVLIRTEKDNPDQSMVFWEGHVFLRNDPNPGYTSTLPQLLGTLRPDENDTWLQDRQTAKADALVREMVWEMIDDNENGVEYYSDLTEESLDLILFPEEDFYLDENGDPVFFIQPGAAAPSECGLLTFPIPLEDILDEM